MCLPQLCKLKEEKPEELLPKVFMSHQGRFMPLVSGSLEQRGKSHRLSYLVTKNIPPIELWGGFYCPESVAVMQSSSISVLPEFLRQLRFR